MLLVTLGVRVGQVRVVGMLVHPPELRDMTHVASRGYWVFR